MSESDTTISRIQYKKIRHIHIGICDVLSGNYHEHGAVELGLVLEGMVAVSDDGNYTATAGELLLFNAYRPHRICSYGDTPVKLLYVQLSPLFGVEFGQQIGHTTFETAALRTLDKSVQQLLRQRLLIAAMAYFREDEAFQFECLAHINQLLTELLRALPHQISTNDQIMTKEANMNRFNRIAAYMEHNCTKKLTLSMLAEAECISSTYMSKLFHDLFGVPFQEYLNLLRLDRALPRLRDPYVHLIDICVECGFSDVRYLNKLCLKKFGCTVSQYRQILQSTEQGNAGENLRKSGSGSQYGNYESLQMVERYLAANSLE